MNAPPPWVWPHAAYVHVPFCRHHCGYCDFAVVAGRDDRIDDYLAALQAELAGLPGPQPVETVFLGGGTPTHLAPAQLARLLGTVARSFSLAPHGEYSVEANPDSLTDDHIAVLAEHGVNRISLGGQSFQRPLLAALERDHDPDAIARAIDRLRGRIAHVSLDLIFGIPGQTLSQWEADLAEAVRLGVEHVSTYGLTYEKGTRLWKQRRRGSLVPLGEEEELAMYRHAIDALEAAGFEHYEISNFCRPGAACRHNEVYWANEAYFGFGLGAARYVEGRREVNTRDLSAYIRRALAGDTVTQQSECLPPAERARETMAVGLRRREGIDRRRFLEQTGYPLDAVAGERLPPLVELGLLIDDSRRVALSRAGKYVADGVIERLL